MAVKRSSPQTTQVEQALYALRGAVSNLRMYSQRSPVTQQALQAAYETVSECLRRAPQVSISDTDDGLTMGGEVPLNVRGFHELLSVHNVRNLRIIRGVSLAEISTLCEGLGKKKADLGREKDFLSWLKARGAEHIHTDSIRYINLKDNEQVVLRGTGQYSSEGSSGVTQSVKETLLNIDQTPDLSVRAILRAELIKEMSQLAPQRLQELLTSQEADAGPLADLLKGLTEALPLRKVEEILRYIAERHHLIKVQAQPFSDQIQRLSLLKTFMHQVLRAPASREISPQLYAYLASLGLLDPASTPARMGGENFSFVAVAENLMGLPGTFLISEPLRGHVLELIRNLCVRDHEDHLKRVIEKILDNVESFEDLIRLKSVDMLVAIHGILSACRKTEEALRLIQTLSDLADKERNLEVYQHLAAALSSIAMDHLLRSQYDEASALAGQLRRHRNEDYLLPEGRQEQARLMLSQFGFRAVEVLCGDLSHADPARVRGAMQVIVQLGEDAVPPIMDILRRTSDARARQSALQALSTLGPAHAAVLLERLKPDEPGALLETLLTLLAPYASPAMVPKLAALVRHPNRVVRREAAALLGLIKEARAPGLLMSLLKDPDPLVQKVAIRGLGGVRGAGAAEALGALVDDASPVLQAEICMALQAIKNPVSIPVLARCLTERAWLLSAKPRFAEPVRVLAAVALGPFSDDPRAIHALKSAAHDANPLVCQTAASVLASMFSH